MSRAQVTDKFQSFRFHVVASPDESLLKFTDAKLGEAGFQAVTSPEFSLDPVEYREGTFTFTQKYPGVPTVGDINMMRGLCRGDTKFYDWIKMAATTGEYRTDLIIKHFHRDEVPPAGAANAGQWGDAKRYIRAHECLPTRVKSDADLDAMTSDISLSEVDAACEYIEVVNPTVSGS